LGILKLFSTQGTRKKDPIEKQTGHILTKPIHQSSTRLEKKTENNSQNTRQRYDKKNSTAQKVEKKLPTPEIHKKSCH